VAAAPDTVCFPTSVDEVAAIVPISAQYRVPIVPFGVRHATRRTRARGARRHNDRLARHESAGLAVEDLDATVAAGVTRLQCEQGARNTGLTFPIDPGADDMLPGKASVPRRVGSHAGGSRRLRSSRTCIRSSDSRCSPPARQIES
jgi:D-lactate dehydrogenase (cytochrome)